MKKPIFKELASEIRMWIAELILSWAFRIAPDTTEGRNMKHTILQYFLSLKVFRGATDTEKLLKQFNPKKIYPSYSEDFDERNE